MRFIHMADIHFDSPFTILTDKKNFGTERRLEQREAFRKAIEYIKEEKIPYLFIAGDLYDQNYIKESTIEFINNLFKTIPDTKIFISPGNHDPFLKNSFYNTYNWNDNVKIFNDVIETIELEDVDIYGYGFSDFYCSNSKVEEIKIENKNKINILLVHGALDLSKNIDASYNPISTNKLKEIGFDYIALGHIHKRTEENKYNMIYPGSMISFGFDELGKHGMLDVIIEKNNKIINNLEKENKKNNTLKNEKIDKNNIKINFIELDNRIFEEKMINISEINSKEELIEKINSIKIEKNIFYKIILIGKRNIEINKNEICKLTTNENILKIKDKSETKYDLDKLAKQNTLKGIFVKRMLDKLDQKNLDEEEVKMAIEIGLKSFE